MLDYFHPFLVNPPSEDPCLYLGISEAKHAILVDCGNNDRLSIKELQRVAFVFISHTHIDHFVGLDNLIRANLRLAKTIHIYGPPGITSQVYHKMSGYTWNLLTEEALDLRVFEICPTHCQETLLSYRNAFQKPYPIAIHNTPQNQIYSTPELDIYYGWLEHKIPCLGYSFVSHTTWSVDKEKLAGFSHKPGPWIKELKALLQQNAAATIELEVAGRRYSLEQLKKDLIVECPGQKLTYVTDTLYTPQTEAAIITLAQNSDLFFCETHFSEHHSDHAWETCHLTARQAGTLARKAGVKKVIGFHYSPRYLPSGGKNVVERELQEAFQGA